MPVINGVYLKDFTALPSSVTDANIIPIAITGDQVAYRTTVGGIVTDARITSKLLTGLSVTGATILATDTILQAFGKVQNQLNGKQDTITLTTTGTSGAATFISNVLNIPQYTDAFVGTVTSVAALTLGTTGTDLSSTVANSTTTPVITLNVPTASAANRGALSAADWTTFNNKQIAGNYITSLTGEATASGPGASSVTLDNTAVIGKVLTGLNVTGGTVISTDSILSAFGKVQNQINGLVGGSIFQGTWNASTNTPALTSSVGTNGHYYIVSVDGSTNLNGITDWKVGDWAIFAGTAWQKVDNTDSVASVNGYTGTVSLVTGDVLEGAGSLPSRPSQLYFTDARARAAISLTTTGSSGASTYNSTTGVLNIPNYLQDLSGYVTLATAQTITAAKTFTTSGNTDTLTINHSSGSGIALNITKGGNGEGIYVNKTSGSGNAVTIIGTLNATTLVKSGGTSSQFLKADGSVDSTSYGTGSVTSVAALTLGTSGTDLSSTVANGTTTPVITLNVPTASASNRGALSSADWSTFNGKQGTITLTTTGTSGAATLSSNTLNIPNYGSALSSYLPLSGGTLTGALSGTSATFSSTVAVGGSAIGRANGIRINGVSVTQTSNTYNAFISTSTTQAIDIGGSLGLGGEVGGDNAAFAVISGRKENSTSGNYAGYFAVSTIEGGASMSEKFRIASTGAATFSGIVNASAGRVNIQGANQNSVWLNQNAGGTSSGFLIGRSLSTTDSQDFFIYDVVAAATRLAITSGGNVLIGTTTDAGYKLDVNGTGRFSSADANLYIQSTSGSGNNWQFQSFSDGNLYINRAGVFSALNINGSSGAATFSSNVIVGGGTTSTSKLTILATTGVAAPGSPTLGIYDASNPTYGFDFDLEGVSTGDLYLSRLVAGTRTAVLQLARATGAATFSSTVTATGFFESSSIKGKDIIKTNPLTNLNLDVIQYTRKTDESKDVRYGYSAEQIHSLMPELTDKDVTAVKYLDVHTLLIAQLQQEIKELKAKLN